MPNDRIDTEIRRLFAELDEASPPPPARPTIPARSIRTYWWRALPVAVAALVVVFVAGAVVLTDGGEESTSDTTTPVAAGVTPTTTVTGAEDPSGESSAAELGPSPTRPTGRVVVLTELNIVCLGFVTAADSALPESPIGPSGHYDAIGKITDPLARLVEGFSAVEIAQAQGENENSVRTRLRRAREAFRKEVDRGRTGGRS